MIFKISLSHYNASVALNTGKGYSCPISGGAGIPLTPTEALKRQPLHIGQPSKHSLNPSYADGGIETIHTVVAVHDCSKLESLLRRLRHGNQRRVNAAAARAWLESLLRRLRHGNTLTGDVSTTSTSAGIPLTPTEALKPSTRQPEPGADPKLESLLRRLRHGNRKRVKGASGTCGAGIPLTPTEALKPRHSCSSGVMRLMLESLLRRLRHGNQGTLAVREGCGGCLNPSYADGGIETRARQVGRAALKAGIPLTPTEALKHRARGFLHRWLARLNPSYADGGIETREWRLVR